MSAETMPAGPAEGGPMTSSTNPTREERAAAHEALVESLVGTGFDYMHVPWRRCACDEARAIRALMKEQA